MCLVVSRRSRRSRSGSGDDRSAGGLGQGPGLPMLVWRSSEGASEVMVGGGEGGGGGLADRKQCCCVTEQDACLGRVKGQRVE